MRHRLHQIGTGCILPITLPLDAERIVLMIAHRDLQVRQVDLALEPSRGRNADMVETRSREYPHFFRLVSEVIGTVSGWERTAVPQAKSRNWSGAGGWQADCIYCEQQTSPTTTPNASGKLRVVVKLDGRSLFRQRGFTSTDLNCSI